MDDRLMAVWSAKPWVRRCVVVGGMVLMGSVCCDAQVVVNEVMFDPLGSEFFDEYVELYNAGDAPVDLTGWRIGDGDETDGLVALGDGMVLASGAYALVLDADYQGHSVLYDPIPKDVLLLTVDSATLGRSGLSNATGELVVLVHALGDTVGAMTYVPGNAPGVSEEKIDPFGGDGVANWGDAKWEGGTPGRVNSVSQKDWDVLLRLVTPSPMRVSWGAVASVDLRVVNVGRRDVDRFDVTLNDRVLAGGFLAAGDSTEVLGQVAPTRAGQVIYRAIVQGAGDQDITNDGVAWLVIAGNEPGQVVISEVMAAPTDGASEWLEVYNRSEEAVDLSGWSIQDRTTTGSFFEGVHLPSGAYALIVEDASAFLETADPVFVLELSRWPRLNDGGDALDLRDATGTVIDRVVYPAGAERGVSLERIDLTVTGDDAQNWLASTDGLRATPGKKNSVQQIDAQVGVSLFIDPNPFDTQTTLTYRLPVSRGFVHLWVFDRLGRKVKTLLTAAEGGAQRQVVWDGRSDTGQILKPGIYVLYLEVGTVDGAILRAKESVVFSGGL